MQLDKKLFEVKEFENGLMVRAKRAWKPFLLKKPGYYKELALLTEALKVEGWWSEKGHISISNKKPELLAFFEDLLKLHQINSKKTWK